MDPVTASSINGGNFNRYWYANDNPYKFVDPDGRFGTKPHKGFCEIVDQCVKNPRIRREVKETESARGETHDKYRALRRRIRVETDDANAVPKLSVTDIETISNYMVMEAKLATKHFGPGAFGRQFAGFDTFLFRDGHGGRTFDVAGLGIMEGGNINYIGVGALFAAYGASKNQTAGGVVVWNLWQYSEDMGDHNLTQWKIAGPWALHGYDQYVEKSADY